MKRIWRYEVPIDDKDHTICLSGYPIHVGLKYTRVEDDRISFTYPSSVEFWTENWDINSPRNITYRVFGTGHDIPDHYYYEGTAARCPITGLVFHLYQNTEPENDR